MKIACHKETRKAHTADCQYAAMIRDEDLAVFDELSEALTEGYREAGCCLTDNPFSEKKKRAATRYSLYCSFCGDQASEHLFQGIDGVQICDECVILCMAKIKECAA